MINDEKYYCVSELGAKILMAISSLIIAISVLYLIHYELHPKTRTISEQDANLVLSSAYALFLPLMSYLFSQAKQYNSEGRAQVILIWMVLIEIIRIHGDPIFTWRLRKSVEQLVRLIWVGFLVCSYAPLHGIRVSLLVLCISYGVFEVLKGIMFKKAKDSNLIGKNPKIIHNYVERIMLQDDLRTTPMNFCNYIVMGEENHEIDVRSNGYVLGERRSSSGGILTIGRVFQLNSSEDEAFTSAFPYWRDICLSLALAKMLRRRFAKLQVLDEAGCRKSLDFVLEGIIDYIGSNRDIQTEGNDGERNPTERVFSIIQEELKYLSEFLHTIVPILHYLYYQSVLGYSILVMLGNGVYLIYTINKKSSAWLSLVVEKAYNHCFSHGFRYGSMVVKIFTDLDLAITILLFIACICIQLIGAYLLDTPRWSSLKDVERYIKDPTEWNRSQSHSSSLAFKYKKVKKVLLSLTHENTKIVKKTREFFFFKKKTRVFNSSIVDVSILAFFPKWIRKIIPRSSPFVVPSTDAKEAILRSLRRSGGQLTNGETSLKNHGMDRLNWACQPHASTTETILVWHIATTLFHNHETSCSNPLLPQDQRRDLRRDLSSLRRDIERVVSITGSCFSFGTAADPISETSAHQNNDPHQEPAPQQNNNPFKEQEVALELSNYCHYLVKYFPDLLPDELDFTEDKYERVQKEILDIPKSTKKHRCNYALQAMWLESSVVGKGARLAKDLMNCAEDEVWKMLADFWAEMMLFIAPSDNVDGHEKILHRGELITQLWALLTHAGIITRPKPTNHQDHQSESSAGTGDMNV